MSKVGGVQVLPFLDVHIELSAFFLPKPLNLGILPETMGGSQNYVLRYTP